MFCVYVSECGPRLLLFATVSAPPFAFHVPLAKLGLCAVGLPATVASWFCQSPDVFVAFVVRSLRNSDGATGRPPGSIAVGSPVLSGGGSLAEPLPTFAGFVPASSAFLIVGDGMRVLAETENGWDRDKAREALVAYKAVQRQQENNLIVVNNIVWLELKALDRPQQAFESSAPLRAVQNNVGLPAEFLDTLGEVYLSVGRFDEAKKVLDEAVRTAGPTPSFYIHLALACHGLKQPEMVERYIGQVQGMKKTPREFNELRSAVNLILQTR